MSECNDGIFGSYNENSGSLGGGGIFYPLNYYYLLENESAPCSFLVYSAVTLLINSD